MTEKHAGGRPRKFQSVEEMSDAIDDFFRVCDERTSPFVTKEGTVIQIPSPAPYTVVGLANVLGLTREGLLEYQARDEYSDTIKKAKAKVHENLEFRLLDGRGYGPGHIFGLKNNYGWKDKHEVDQKTSMTFSFDKARAPEKQEEEGL